MSRITLQQIATTCRVGYSTVTQVLNGTGGNVRVSEARARHIREVAQGLGYRPNAIARAMRSGRFGAVAMLLSPSRHLSFLPDPLLSGITTRLNESGLRLTIEAVGDDKLTDPEFVPLILREWCVDGLLINYTNRVPARLEELLRSSGHPSVWINADRPDDTLRPDDVQAGYLAAQHLHELGHRRIAYVDLNLRLDALPGSDHYSKLHRCQGYCQFMRETALPPRLLSAGASVDTATAVLTAALAEADRPTAVVATDGGRVERAATRAGLRVPEDLSIIRFINDRRDGGEHRLTAVVAPHREVGYFAADHLIRRISERKGPSPTRALPFTLMSGYSTAPP
jgi:DNA-binding LacI/PurR family transcriptional regulator